MIPRARLGLSAVIVIAMVPGLILAFLTWGPLRRGVSAVPWDAVCTRDYLNVWAAGRLAALDGFATLFHPDAYDHWLKSVFGPALVTHTWSYPPTMVALALPLALLPLVPGFLVWAGSTVALLAGVLRGCGVPALTCLAVACSPAVIENALAGQNGALTAALLEGGLLLAGRRPVLSGVLLGLLTTKPHLGLLVPICLVAAGQWRTIAAATLTALLMVAASIAAFGVSSWVWYLTDVRQFMTASILERPWSGLVYQEMMPTLFMLARGVGASLNAAYALQIVLAAGCTAAAWCAWRRPGADPKARTALTASLALLATPYCYSYDMIGVTVGVALLTGLALQTGFRRLEAPLLGLAWMWPGLAFWLGQFKLPPLGCLVLAGVAVCAWRRLQPVRVVQPARQWADRLAATGA